MESSIFEVVKAYLVANYKVPPDTIDWKSDVVSDLGLSLKDLAELTAALEKEYDVKLLNSESLYLRNVGQLVNFIVIKVKT